MEAASVDYSKKFGDEEKTTSTSILQASNKSLCKGEREGESKEGTWEDNLMDKWESFLNLRILLKPKTDITNYPKKVLSLANKKREEHV